MNLAIASDHAGFEMKQQLIAFIKELGHEIKDFGPYEEGSVDYPDYAHPLALSIEKGEYDFGISLCGSGNGITMTLNKHQGIRAALCWITEIATLARQHNNANICSLPARYLSVDQAKEIVSAFLTTDFEGGRHETRVNKIACKS